MEMGTENKIPLEYDDLLTKQINGEFPKRLLVEGEGGAGKTTYCSKIAWDWANGYEAYEHFDWVIVIPMREMENCKTLGEIAKTYLSDGNMVQPRQIDDYILSKPSKVLIIFDGLDEYSRDIFSDESDFGKIIRSEKFKECIILVTSRPWKANQIKSHQRLCKIYTFIGVEGFSSENVSSYIKKYFVNDNMAGADLITFMEYNDVIKMNMAPFPIYVAMLCILWQESTKERREVIRKLKTFSQLFHQMIAFLKEHYISKKCNTLTEMYSMETESINKFLIEIGKIAFSGLLDKRLTFNEKDFSLCKEAMDVCSKIGVLSREKRFARRVERAGTKIQHVTFDVSFPHKLFQEYVAALYLDSLYEYKDVEYITSIEKILKANMYEFRYLIYFTSFHGKGIGLDIINRLVKQKCEVHFLVDVAFEAYDADSGKVVGQTIFREQNSLEINDGMSAHTLSGYLFIMEKHAMKALILSVRKCGPTVSRDLADALSSPTSLTSLTLSKTNFHGDFYRVLLDHVSTLKSGESINAVQKLHIDDLFIDSLQEFDTTIEVLFPRLKQLTLTTLQTVSPGVVERLAHSSLAALSIEHGAEEEKLVPLIGEPASLGQLFSSSFPQLTCLTFRGLVMGNIRSEAILHNLKNHLHLKSISIIRCFTDDELDPLAEQITTENRMKITLQHDTAQRTLLFGGRIGPLTINLIDALCHRTCVRQLDVNEKGVEIAGEECFPDIHGRKVNSKIQKFIIISLHLHDDQSASYCLGKFLSLLPHLTDLTLVKCSLHYDFYKQIADRASSSQIQKFIISSLHLHDDQSSSGFLGGFLSLLPHLTDLKIYTCDLYSDFYKEIADRASSSQIQKFIISSLHLHDDLSSGFLGGFLSLLPHLTDLEIDSCSLHGDFYREIADRASSSQIQKFIISSLHLHDQSSSGFLGRFLSLLPHLTDLKIYTCDLHNDFYKEIADQASLSQIQKFIISYLYLHDDQSASYCLGKFLSLLSHLTDLEINSCSLYDDFYKEIADQATSSQIQTVNLDLRWIYNLPVQSQSVSKQLAKFLCSLPCLKTIEINMDGCLHDDFFVELSSLAASSQIQTVKLVVCRYYTKQGEVLIGRSASKQVAKFLCSLPCLTTLAIRWYSYLHDDFFTELASLAASSQNPYFREKKYTRMLENYWSARKPDIPSTSILGFAHSNRGADQVMEQEDTPQVEAPQVDAPQVDAPQVEAPQVEAPRQGPTKKKTVRAQGHVRRLACHFPGASSNLGPQPDPRAVDNQDPEPRS